MKEYNHWELSHQDDEDYADPIATPSRPLSLYEAVANPPAAKTPLEAIVLNQTEFDWSQKIAKKLFLISR